MNRQTIFSIFGAALLGLASMACGDGNTDPDDDSVDPIGDRLQPTWARSAGGPSLDQGVDVATDRSGNVFLTGEFRGVATFEGTTLTTHGDADMFVAKYEANGDLLWVRSAGGTERDRGWSIATDPSGDVIVAGLVNGTATFEGTTVTSSGFEDLVVAKYDAAGDLLWVRLAGGTEPDRALGVATDPLGNVVVTGEYRGTATFGGTTLTSAGAADIFVVKYDSDGNLIWAQSAGGVGDDGGSGIATDAMGQVVMTGSFAENATFAGTTLTGEGGLDVFTAKYDAGGDLLWARSAGGRDYDYGVDIAIDPSGNVFVAGDYWITAIFGTVTLTSRGLDDIFVAKYDAAGNFLWARSAGGVLADDGSSGLATDPAGNVLMTGLFQGTIWFGETALASLGSFDIIVAKYGSAGDLLWARSAGGPDGDFGGSIATDPSGSLVVSGGFAATASFGDVTLASAGWVDIFVLKTGPNGLN